MAETHGSAPNATPPPPRCHVLPIRKRSTAMYNGHMRARAAAAG
jgi:hypothetical protein